MNTKVIYKSNIAILTTAVNFELYEITSKFFPQGIKKYVIDGRDGMFGIHSIYYMFDKLANRDIDWLILADEDVVFKDGNVVFSIIDKMNAEDFYVCGIRDGGIISHRIYNPNMVNTFFTIINFKKILKIWDKKEIRRNQYVKPFEFKLDKINLLGKYDENSIYEPYYCFFLWLKRKNKKFLYLESQMLEDNITNTIFFDNKEFALHTWYARSYKKNKKHTDRINKVLFTLSIDFSILKTDSNVIILKDDFFFLKMKLKKIYNQFSNRIKNILLNFINYYSSELE